MKFYSFQEIQDRGSCIDFVQNVLCLEIDRNGRCAAVWRGGDGANVAIKDNEWYDQVEKKGGGIIELCAIAKFNGDKQQAQNFLGEWLNLKPRSFVKKNAAIGSNRYDSLIEKGYKEVKRYLYKDLDGNVVHFVTRLEHEDPELDKKFVQGTPDAWTLKGVEPILYRLKDWINRTFVCIVEGEKDADTLLSIGLPATTNSGGADKWRESYNQHFEGKNLVIVRDNDTAGEKHAKRVAQELKNVAGRMIIICPSKLPKGDVTDYFEKENGTKESFVAMMKASPEIDKSKLEDLDPAIEKAKQANRYDLQNFTEYNEQQEKKTVTIRQPRQINALIKEIHTRFCGFPRRVGGSRFMFDFDHDKKEIVYLHDPSELFAWIGRKSKRKVVWGQGDALVTKSEIFKGLLAEAITYESISNVPDWPTREDVFYSHDILPEPSESFTYFNGFINFFAPADVGYRTLLKALVCAPIWYEKGIPRPGWIIDSPDGAGTGKTTLIELISQLYTGAPIRTNKQELRTNVSEIIKRLVSTEGRLGRILLVDNVTGDFQCSELADFMTAQSISGKAPYGRGEETRPNNLTYVITANSATVDNDLSERCFFVHVKRVKRSGSWKSKVLNYIEQNRLRIFADIIGMLDQSRVDEIEPKTRFPEFEESILRGVCMDRNEYDQALLTLQESRASSNIEEEQAKTIEDEFLVRLTELDFAPQYQQIFIQSDVIKTWVSDILGIEFKSAAMQTIRNLAKNGLTQRFLVKPEKFPHRETPRQKPRRGIMWNPPEKGDLFADEPPVILGMRNRKFVKVEY